MPIPTFLAQQIGVAQPLITASEESETQGEIWAPDGGADAQERTFTDEVVSAAVKGGAAYGLYVGAPTVAGSVRDGMRSDTFQRWALRPGDEGINTVGDSLSLRGASFHARRIRANLANALTSGLTVSNPQAYEDSATFWYTGLKKVEQSGFGLPIIDNVIKLFTKATYLSDVLSFSARRENRPRIINISMQSLGETGRDLTLEFYSQHLRIDRNRLNLIDFLVWENGQVYEGVRDASGRVTRRIHYANGRPTMADPLARDVRLADKGKYTEAALTLLNPRYGTKDAATGATLAESIGGGKEGYILFRNELDPDLRRIGGMFAGLFGVLGRSLAPDESTRVAASNAAFHAETYVSMALSRTSGLVSEMYNEVGNFFEYLFPDAQRRLFAGLNESGLVPRMTHGHGAGMLARYSTVASSVGLGLMAVNQLGWSMRNGNAVEEKVAGIGQTTLLAMTGAYVGNRFFRRRMAGFAAGGVLGGLGMADIGPFANGPIPGLANLAARANEVRSAIGELQVPVVGFSINKYKRSIEEMMPGSTDLTTALGVGVLGGTGYVSLQRFLNRNRIVEESDRARYLYSSFESILGRENAPDLSLQDIGSYTQNVSGRIQEQERIHAEELRTAAAGQAEQLRNQHQQAVNAIRQEEWQDMHYRVTGEAPAAPLDLDDLTEQQRRTVENNVNSYVESLRSQNEIAALNNPLGHINDSSNLRVLAENITAHTYEEGRQRILQRNEGFMSRIMTAIEQAPRGRAIAYAAALGTAAWWMATGGPGTIQTPREMRELNTGKRLEAVRRNQSWEMGQGAYEGDDILFYRPTLTARLSSGAAQAGASGNRGPLEEFFLKNFTYQLERENYYKKPAPITGAAFDQIPFIYPVIQPIADLIKRPKLMHQDEWMRKDPSGRKLYLERSTGLEEVPDQRLGATPMAAPVSPYSPTRVIGKAYEEATSLAGLVGFYAKTAKKFFTGNESIGNAPQELESFSRNMDIDSKFYDLHGGGSFLGIPFTSEVIRRFVHKDKLQQYNPIQNAMPSWLPENFRYGNPSTSLRHGGGEYRMPGEGYAALHKELQGVDPEQYPLVHKLAILGDLAPYSSEYNKALGEAKVMQERGQMSDSEMRYMYMHQEMVKARKNRRVYDNYQFKPGSYDNVSGTIESVDAENMTFTISGYGGRFGLAGITNDASALIGQFNLSQKELAAKRISNMKAFTSNIGVGDTVTVDIPASIGHAVDDQGIIRGAVRNNFFNVNKEVRGDGDFAKEDSPIGNYAMTNYLGKVIGATWEAGMHFANRMAQPIEHIGMFGAAPINKLLPYRSALEEYEAREVYGTEMKGWEDPIKGWIAPALRTAFHNYLGVDFEAPALNRKREIDEYFDKLKYLKYTSLSESALSYGDVALSNEYNIAASRTTFGSMGSINDNNLAQALGGREAMFASGFANEFNPEQQEKILEALPENKRRIMEEYYNTRDMDAINRASTMGPMSSTGMDYSEELYRNKENLGYKDAENPTMADAMQKQELEKYFQDKVVPRADWIGFNPAVDLEDVKLKYIQNEGMDYHDFGIFPNRANFISRKNYIDQQAIEDLNSSRHTDFFGAMSAISKREASYGNYSYNIQGPDDTVNFVQLNVKNNIPIDIFAGLQ